MRFSDYLAVIQIVLELVLCIAVVIAIRKHNKDHKASLMALKDAIADHKQEQELTEQQREGKNAASACQSFLR